LKQAIHQHCFILQKSSKSKLMFYKTRKTKVQKQDKDKQIHETRLNKIPNQMFFKQIDVKKVIQASMIKMILKFYGHHLGLTSTLNLKPKKIKIAKPKLRH
jgi:hypothetical protein